MEILVQTYEDPQARTLESENRLGPVGLKSFIVDCAAAQEKVEVLGMT